MFNVEIRDNCKECGRKIENSRLRTYCGGKCRRRAHNKKRQPYSTERQRIRRDKLASIPDPNKIQCLFCGKYYIQICTHAYQIHGVTGREYREHFELEVKRGVTPEWYRKLKGEQALDNKTFENLKHGVKFQFEKGSKKAGRYKRSPVTIERIRNLHKLKEVGETEPTN